MWRTKRKPKRFAVICNERVVSVRREDFVIETGSLGRGETEALALAKQLKADVLLVDDERVRKIAVFNTVPIIGSLGIVLLAKHEGLISRVGPMVETLRRSDIFVSNALLAKVLKLAGE